MGLAGNVKLKHFLLVVSGVSILCCCGGGFWLWRSLPEPSATKAAPPTAAAPLATAPTPAATAPAVAAPVIAPAGSSPSDAAVFAWKGKNLGSDKIKDASRGQAFKVNLYQDAGSPAMNRAKVDLDRDDKWDEKWTFQGDEITREVAPADDEVYSQSFTWSGTGWVSK